MSGGFGKVRTDAMANWQFFSIYFASLLLFSSLIKIESYFVWNSRPLEFSSTEQPYWLSKGILARTTVTDSPYQPGGCISQNLPFLADLDVFKCLTLVIRDGVGLTSKDYIDCAELQGTISIGRKRYPFYLHSISQCCAAELLISAGVVDNVSFCTGVKFVFFFQPVFWRLKLNLTSTISRTFVKSRLKTSQNFKNCRNPRR